MAKIAFANSNTIDRIFDLIDQIGVETLNFGRHLTGWQVAAIEKNLKSAKRKKLNQEQIERFEKNKVKIIFGKGEKSVVYGIGSNIYANINNYFLQLL